MLDQSLMSWNGSLVESTRIDYDIERKYIVCKVMNAGVSRDSFKQKSI